MTQKFYSRIREKLGDIDEIRLVYAQEEPGRIQVTVFYDELAENYSKLETHIFDAFDECDEQFPEVETRILVMVYTDSTEPPIDSEVLLLRLMENCPMCDGSPIKIRLLDIHGVRADDEKFYDRIYQCEHCLHMFQHIFWKKDNKLQISCYFGAISFMYQNKGTKEWW